MPSIVLLVREAKLHLSGSALHPQQERLARVSSSIVVGSVYALSRCPLFYPVPRLRDRFKRLGKEGELKTISTDTCCEGLKRPEDHLVAKLFPGVDRAPHGDNFHKAQILCSSINNHHPLRAEFCRYTFLECKIYLDKRVAAQGKERQGNAGNH